MSKKSIFADHRRREMMIFHLVTCRRILNCRTVWATLYTQVILPILSAYSFLQEQVLWDTLPSRFRKVYIYGIYIWYILLLVSPATLNQAASYGSLLSPHSFPRGKEKWLHFKASHIFYAWQCQDKISLRAKRQAKASLPWQCRN